MLVAANAGIVLCFAEGFHGSSVMGGMKSFSKPRGSVRFGSEGAGKSHGSNGVGSGGF